MSEPLVLDLDSDGVMSADMDRAIVAWWAVEQGTWKTGCLHLVCRELRAIWVKERSRGGL